MKILVIEDEKLIRQSICFVASKKGHAVEGAETGKEGLKLWKEWKPDLVFIDLALPDQTGFDVMDKMLPYSYAKVVMMSAYAQYEKLAKERGAHLFIRKPFSSVFEIFNQAITQLEDKARPDLSPAL